MEQIETNEDEAGGLVDSLDVFNRENVPLPRVRSFGIQDESEKKSSIFKLI